MSRIERPLYGRFKKRGKILNKNSCFGEDFHHFANNNENDATYKKNFTSKNFQIGEYTESEKLITNIRPGRKDLPRTNALAYLPGTSVTKTFVL